MLTNVLLALCMGLKYYARLKQVIVMALVICKVNSMGSIIDYNRKWFIVLLTYFS
jgi:hypothetical protein